MSDADWLPIERAYLTRSEDDGLELPAIIDAMAAMEKKTLRFRGVRGGGELLEALQSFGWELPALVQPPFPLIMHRLTGADTNNRAWGGFDGTPLIEPFTGGFRQHRYTVQIDVILGPYNINTQSTKVAGDAWVEMFDRAYSRNMTLGNRCDYAMLIGGHMLNTLIRYAGYDWFGHRLRAAIGVTYLMDGPEV